MGFFVHQPYALYLCRNRILFHSVNMPIFMGTWILWKYLRCYSKSYPDSMVALNSDV